MDALAKRAARPRPFLLVLSAPSGGGKTTVCDRVLRRETWLKRCVTATTRAPRKGERNGRDYWFLSVPEFRARVKRGGFYEWARVHGNFYGTPRAEVEKALKRGQSLVLVIDVQGGKAVRRKSREAVLCFLMPPSLAALKARLRGRGKDSAAVVARRLRDARHEIRQSEFYDYVVLNQRLAEAVEAVRDIARAERWRGL